MSSINLNQNIPTIISDDYKEEVCKETKIKKKYQTEPLNEDYLVELKVVLSLEITLDNVTFSIEECQDSIDKYLESKDSFPKEKVITLSGGGVEKICKKQAENIKQKDNPSDIDMTFPIKKTKNPKLLKEAFKNFLKEKGIVSFDLDAAIHSDYVGYCNISIESEKENEEGKKITLDLNCSPDDDEDFANYKKSHRSKQDSFKIDLVKKEFMFSKDNEDYRKTNEEIITFSSVEEVIQFNQLTDIGCSSEKLDEIERVLMYFFSQLSQGRIADETFIDKLLEKYFEKFQINQFAFEGLLESEIDSFLKKHTHVSKYPLKISILLNILFQAYPTKGSPTSTPTQKRYFDSLYRIIFKKLLEEKEKLKDSWSTLSKKYLAFHLINLLENSSESFEKVYDYVDKKTFPFFMNQDHSVLQDNKFVVISQQNSFVKLNTLNGTEKAVKKPNQPNLLFRKKPTSVICEELFETFLNIENHLELKHKKFYKLQVNENPVSVLELIKATNQFFNDSSWLRNLTEEDFLIYIEPLKSLLKLGYETLDHQQSDFEELNCIYFKTIATFFDQFDEKNSKIERKSTNDLYSFILKSPEALVKLKKMFQKVKFKEIKATFFSIINKQINRQLAGQTCQKKGDDLFFSFYLALFSDDHKVLLYWHQITRSLFDEKKVSLAMYRLVELQPYEKQEPSLFEETLKLARKGCLQELKNQNSQPIKTLLNSYLDRFNLKDALSLIKNCRVSDQPFLYEFLAHYFFTSGAYERAAHFSTQAIILHKKQKHNLKKLEKERTRSTIHSQIHELQTNHSRIYQCHTHLKNLKRKINERENKEIRAKNFLQVALEEEKSGTPNFNKIDYYLILAEESGSLEATIKLLKIYLEKGKFKFAERQRRKIEKLGTLKGLRLAANLFFEKGYFCEANKLFHRIIHLEKGQIGLFDLKNDVINHQKWLKFLEVDTKRLNEGEKKLALKIKKRIKKEEIEKNSIISDTENNRSKNKITKTSLTEAEETIFITYIKGKENKRVLWEIYQKIKKQPKSIIKKEASAKIGNLQDLEILSLHYLILSMSEKDESNANQFREKATQLRIKLSLKQYERSLKLDERSEKKMLLNQAIHTIQDENFKINDDNFKLYSLEVDHKKTDNLKVIKESKKAFICTLNLAKEQVEEEEKQEIKKLENSKRSFEIRKIFLVEQIKIKKENKQKNIEKELQTDSSEQVIDFCKNYLEYTKNLMSGSHFLEQLIGLDCLLEKIRDLNEKDPYQETIISIKESINNLGEKYTSHLLNISTLQEDDQDEDVHSIRLQLHEKDLQFYTLLGEFYFREEGSVLLDNLLKTLKSLDLFNQGVIHFKGLINSIQIKLNTLKLKNFTAEEKGNFYLQNKEYQEALAAFLEIKEKTDSILIKMGYCHLILKQTSIESKILVESKFTNETSAFYESRYYLALYYYHNGSKETREKSFQIVEELTQSLKKVKKNSIHTELSKNIRQLLVLCSIYDGKSEKYENNLRRLLDEGDPLILFQYGLYCILSDEGLTKQGINYIKKAADQNNGEALLFLGRYHKTRVLDNPLFSKPSKKNIRKAIDYLSRSFQLKNSFGVTLLCELYENYPLEFRNCGQEIRTDLEQIKQELEKINKILKPSHQNETLDQKTERLLNIVWINQEIGNLYGNIGQIYSELAQTYCFLFKRKKNEIYLVEAMKYFDRSANEQLSLERFNLSTKMTESDAINFVNGAKATLDLIKIGLLKEELYFSEFDTSRKNSCDNLISYLEPDPVNNFNSLLNEAYYCKLELTEKFGEKEEWDLLVKEYSSYLNKNPVFDFLYKVSFIKSLFVKEMNGCLRFDRPMDEKAKITIIKHLNDIPKYNNLTVDDIATQLILDHGKKTYLLMNNFMYYQKIFPTLPLELKPILLIQALDQFSSLKLSNQDECFHINFGELAIEISPLDLYKNCYLELEKILDPKKFENYKNKYFVTFYIEDEESKNVNIQDLEFELKKERLSMWKKFHKLIEQGDCEDLQQMKKIYIKIIRMNEEKKLNYPIIGDVYSDLASTCCRLFEKENEKELICQAILWFYYEADQYPENTLMHISALLNGVKLSLLIDQDEGLNCEQLLKKIGKIENSKNQSEIETMLVESNFCKAFYLLKKNETDEEGTQLLIEQIESNHSLFAYLSLMLKSKFDKEMSKSYLSVDSSLISEPKNVVDRLLYKKFAQKN